MFMLFGGGHYYPSGGAYDLHGIYDTLEEAEEDGKVYFGGEFEWWHVYDVSAKSIVAKG